MKSKQEEIEHIDLILKYTEMFVHEDYKEKEINQLLDERLELTKQTNFLSLKTG